MKPGESMIKSKIKIKNGAASNASVLALNLDLDPRLPTA
jgi:hypothetical protein